MFENFSDISATGDTLITAMIIGVCFGIAATVAFYSFILHRDKHIEQ